LQTHKTGLRELAKDKPTIRDRWTARTESRLIWPKVLRSDG